MNETKFNSDFRAVLRAQGMGNLHIREADQPGPADLVVWHGQRLLAWVELKIEDHEVESHQWQFLEDRVAEGGKAFVIRLWARYAHEYPFAVTVEKVLGTAHQTETVGRHVDFHRVQWFERYFK